MSDSDLRAAERAEGIDLGRRLRAGAVSRDHLRALAFCGSEEAREVVGLQGVGLDGKPLRLARWCDGLVRRLSGMTRERSFEFFSMRCRERGASEVPCGLLCGGCNGTGFNEAAVLLSVLLATKAALAAGHFVQLEGERRIALAKADAARGMPRPPGLAPQLPAEQTMREALALLRAGNEWLSFPSDYRLRVWRASEVYQVPGWCRISPLADCPEIELANVLLVRLRSAAEATTERAVVEVAARAVRESLEELL